MAYHQLCLLLGWSNDLQLLYMQFTQLQARWRRTVPTPILLEELGQQPLADMWLLRAAGFWNSLMTGSAFHKAMAQDVVHLMQVTGTKGWVAGLSTALQRAGYAFQRSTFRALTLGGCKPCSQMAGRGSGMILTLALAQLLRKVPGTARMNGGSGSRLRLVPPH